jgi:dolichol-phosphate mannosyltransferase
MKNEPTFVKKTIGIIIPVFNEAENIEQLNDALQQIFTSMHSYAFELLFIDDGSKDESWNIITSLMKKDSNISALKFSRNFGYQAALTAGYDTIKGIDAVITMDADLQHPPSLIPEMIATWEKGYSIVYARRRGRNDTFFKKITARIYSSMLNAITEVKIPEGISDFRLIDNQVLQAIKQCREQSRYLRGLIAWTGFAFTFVDFNQPARLKGNTQSWFKLIKMAADGLASFSLFPLKIAAFVGIFAIITGFIMLGIITIDALFFKGYYPLFKWLVTIIYIFIGILFILLWILGEYIGRLFEQQENRPLYIIAQQYIKLRGQDNV